MNIILLFAFLIALTSLSLLGLTFWDLIEAGENNKVTSVISNILIIEIIVFFIYILLFLF